MRAILALAALASLSGCSLVKQTNTQTVQTTNGPETKVLRSVAFSLFDGKAAANGVKISNGKTLSVGVEATGAESSSTNAAGTLDALARLLGALPK